jgi:ribose transport system ATP-binding protein
MADPLLQMKGIVKRFQGVTALRSVDFEIFPGEVLALIGENGAGKSTLMKILGGVHQPDEGVINLDGKPTTFHSVSESIAKGIGFIHQELNLLDNLDVAGNVFLGREPVWGGPLRLLDYGKMQRDTEVHLKRLGMQISSRTNLATLSIAHQQMVEIAKALSLHARILIMDEPTSSLTLSETARLLDVVKQLRSEGVSIIYVSHRLSEITEVADRVTVLRDGANAGGLSKNEITRERMVKMMIGRDLEDFYVHPDAAPRPGYFEVKGLRTARFPKREVSFSVGQGEILGMAGLVGAGRTEVAQAICGIDQPQAGSMALDQKPIQIQSPKDAVANGIYLVPDDRRRFGLVIDMSVCENMTLPALSRYSSQGIINSKAERKAAEEGVKKLNVKTHSVNARVGNLSGGNQQKVILAKWLALNPKVLILDEPTRGIDVGAKAEIYSLLRALAKEGVAIIAISSDMEEVLGISDRVAVMHEGSLTGILDRQDLNEEAIMKLAVN